MKQQKIVIGVSGGGTTMEAIAKEIQSGKLDLELGFVFTDRDCGAIIKAQKMGIKIVQKKESETIKEFHDRLVEKLKKDRVDIVVLAGYLRLFPVLASDPYLVINSHPGAIPEFGGTGFWGPKVHETVLEFAKATNFRHPYTYSTVHVASAEYDKGDILGLVQMEITPEDTAETIAARLLPLEHQNYIEVLRKLSAGEIQALANFDDLVLPQERNILTKVRQNVQNENRS